MTKETYVVHETCMSEEFLFTDSQHGSTDKFSFEFNNEIDFWCEHEFPLYTYFLF